MTTTIFKVSECRNLLSEKKSGQFDFFDRLRDKSFVYLSKIIEIVIVPVVWVFSTLVTL